MRKLRIGILTYHFSDNFGALLQAYALKAWLEKEGHCAEFINYHPQYVEEGGNFEQVLNPKRFRKNLKIMYLKVSRLQSRIFGNREQKTQIERFRREVLGVNGLQLRTQEEVETFIASPQGKFDVLVCGSDQIWNPSVQKGIDPVYFLAMADATGARHVAYAPSFGRGTLDQSFDDEVGRCLAGMHGLSVREESGVEIVGRITGRNAVCVPDPTILLGNFSALIGKANPVRQTYVFCHALRTGNGIREVARMVSRECGAPIISPYNIYRRWREIGETVYPSPSGWVAMIDQSVFVVTNSFHGTALAILQNRPFLTVGLPGAKSALNERVSNLLRQLDLSDRLVEAGDLNTARHRINEGIDWEGVSVRLAQLQHQGREFLQAQLESAHERGLLPNASTVTR